MRRLAIVGLGLIGGSLGLAVRARRADLQVVGVSRTERTATLARDLGAVHHASTDLADIAEAEMVVLACPLAVQEEVLEACVPHLAQGAVVTDVGSVKGSVVRHALRTLDPGRNPFLGGHPMAGREVGGVENAEAGLFEGRVWVFTPAPVGRSDQLAGAVAAGRSGARPRNWPREFIELVDLVRDVGAIPVSLTPEAHDRYVALVSHLPFILSAALLKAAGDQPGWDEAKWLAASGFRDASRLGGGDPEMYAAIAGQNRDALLDAIGFLRQALASFEAAVGRGEPGDLEALFAATRAVRADWIGTAEAPGRG